MKKTSTAAIIVAVIATILILPCLLAFGFSSSTVAAVSNIFEESKDEKLFERFEADGGITWIYEEVQKQLVDMEASAGLPEGRKLLADAITYEELRDMLYDIYNCVLSGKEYRFDLSAQKERIKKNLEAYADEYAEEYANDYIASLGVPFVSEQLKKEVIENEKKRFLTEAYAQIDDNVFSLEDELNQMLASIYQSEPMMEMERFKVQYNIGELNWSQIHHWLRSAALILLVVTVVLLLLLLLSYLFRPAGFVVSGVGFLLLGAGMVALSLMMRGIKIAEVLPSGQMPAYNAVIGVGDELVTWLADGYHTVSIYSAIAGGVLVIIGVVLYLVRRSREDE